MGKLVTEHSGMDTAFSEYTSSKILQRLYFLSLFDTRMDPEI